MYQGNNSIAIQSQKMMMQALLSLMQKKDFGKIQVKELCEAAQVSRQTFYSLFDSKEQILELYFDSIFNSFMQEIKNSESLSLSIVCSAAIRCLISHHLFIGLLIKNKMDYILYRKLEQYLLNFSEEINVTKSSNDKYAIAFLSGAMTGIIRKYIENDAFNNDKVISNLVELILTGNYFTIDPSLL